MTQVLVIDDLRLSCNQLLDLLDERFGSSVALDDGFPADYWKVDLEAAYSLVSSPEIVVGEFREDVDEVMGLARRAVDSVSLWHDLDHLSGLLRGLAFMDLPPR